MIAAVLNVPVIVESPTAVTDEYGDTVESWETPARHLTRCFPQPSTGQEGTINGVLVTDRWKVFLPADTPVRADSRLVLHDGATVITVVEPPRPVLDHLGRVHHVEVTGEQTR